MRSALARKVHWTEEEYISVEEGSAIKHEYFDEALEVLSELIATRALLARLGADLKTVARRTPVIGVVTKTDLALAFDNLTYRLTLRLGSMIGIGIAALFVLQCFH